MPRMITNCVGCLLSSLYHPIAKDCHIMTDDIISFIAVFGGLAIVLSLYFGRDFRDEIEQYWRDHEQDRPTLRHPHRGKYHVGNTPDDK